jgi:hypothetical protein
MDFVKVAAVNPERAKYNSLRSFFKANQQNQAEY